MKHTIQGKPIQRHGGRTTSSRPRNPLSVLGGVLLALFGDELVELTGLAERLVFFDQSKSLFTAF